MRSDMGPDMFFFEIFQIHDELSDLGDVVTDER